MIRATFLVALLTGFPQGSVQAQERSFDPDFMKELQALGLEQEAFAYALNWAAQHDEVAEVFVSNALIDGKGVKANPVTAIQFVCGERAMSAYQKRKIIIKANLRLEDPDGAVKCKP